MSFSIPTLRAFIGKISTGGGGSTYDFSTLCANWPYDTLITSGYGWIINGLDMSTNGLPNSSTLNINFNDDIKELATYATSATYSISGQGPGAACDFSAITGNISYGMSDIVLNYSSLVSGCEDGTDLQMYINIAGLATGWWEDNCCAGLCAYTSFNTFWTLTWGPF